MLIAETRTRIHAPQERVRDFLLDPMRLPSYSEKARTVEMVSHTPEVVRVNGTFGGQRYTAELVIVRAPEAGFACEVIETPLPYRRGEFLMHEEDGFTILVHREEWRFRGSWTECLLSRYIQNAAAREVDLVKQQVELAFIHELLAFRPDELPVTLKPKAGPKAGSWLMD